MSRGPIRLCVGLAVMFGASGRLWAQQRSLEPSPAMARMLNVAPVPLVSLSPDYSRFLILERPALPLLAEASLSTLLLAGQRINPRNNVLADISTYSALVVQPIGRGETRRIVIPWKARVAYTMWAPEGDRVAFTVVEDAGMSLWVAEGWSGESRMLAGPVLNAAFGNPCQWLPSGSGLLCLKLPAGRGGPPVGNAALLEYHFASQLALYQRSGVEREVGIPGLHRRAQVSPDGRFVLVETIKRPLSPEQPSRSLPTRTEVWDLSGAVLNIVADWNPADDSARSNARVPSEPRSIGWRQDAPSTLAWVEALDGGDPAAAAGDRIVLLEAPFSGKPTVLMNLEWRFDEILWGRRDLAVVTERWAGTAQTRTWLVDPSQAGGAPRLFSERSAQDRYADPGTFVTNVGPGGGALLVTSRDGRFAFLRGAGASLTGDRPFLDRLELPLKRLFRLWRSEAPFHEEVIAVADPDDHHLITRRESAREAPNYFIRDLRKKGPAQLARLTQFADPSPEFATIGRQLLTYVRRDGVQLSAMLYLPSAYRPGLGPLPVLLWADPRRDWGTRTAPQVTGSPYRFVRPVDVPHLALVLEGFAVVDEVAMPMTGAATSAGQSRAEQAAASATAAIRKLVGMGVGDAARMAVGGAEPGAVAELLEHTDLFRAGISLGAGAGDSSGSPKAPLLLVQGIGTGPGATPARETVGRSLAEMAAWLDRYLKSDAAKSSYRP